MSHRKARLTVTVDPELIRAGNAAVRSGRAGSLSGWVNLALEERATKERRLKALAEAVSLYEAEFGEISATELAAQSRADRRAAVVIRGGRRSAGASRRAGRAR